MKYTKQNGGRHVRFMLSEQVLTRWWHLVAIKKARNLSNQFKHDRLGQLDGQIRLPDLLELFLIIDGRASTDEWCVLLCWRGLLAADNAATRFPLLGQGQGLTLRLRSCKLGCVAQSP